MRAGRGKKSKKEPEPEPEEEEFDEEEFDEEEFDEEGFDDEGGPAGEDLVHECEVCASTYDDFDEAVACEEKCAKGGGTLEEEAEDDAEELASAPLPKGAIALTTSLSCDVPEDLIALSKLRDGDVEEAHELLQEVGYQYRYSDAALTASLGKKDKAKKPAKGTKKSTEKKCNHAKIFDGVLPEADLAMMKGVFCAWEQEGDYWEDNRYHEASRFISWSHKLGAAPQNVLEQVSEQACHTPTFPYTRTYKAL